MRISYARQKTLSSAVILAALIFSCPRPAAAQSPIGAYTLAEDEGLRISDHGRFHFFGNFDLHYDTNTSYMPQGQEISDLTLRLRGGVKLAVPSERLELNFLGEANWVQYLGLINRQTRNLSGIQGSATFSLIANKNGALSFLLDDSFMRSAGPANAVVGKRLLFINNSARAGVVIRPGGRALEIQLSYGFSIIYYDKNQPTLINADALSYYNHNFRAGVLWRFFPKTAATLDVEGNMTRFPWGAGGTIVNIGSNPVRAQAGLAGLLTEKLSLKLSVGYGNSILMPPAGTTVANYSSVIGTAQVTWKPTEFIEVFGGYTRDFTPTSIFAYIGTDTLFAEYKHLIWSRFIASLKLNYVYQSFGGSTLPGVGSRHDNVIRGDVRFTYQMRKWVAGSIYYIPDIRLTAFKSPAGVSGQYIRHVVGFDVTFAY